MSAEIKEVARMPQLRELAELFSSIWGFADPLDASTLRALSHSGNYVAAAFAEGHMIGGLVGWLGGEPPNHLHMHSHILGVLPTTQARGVGFALKQHQRDWCMARGVMAIEWTFDPLVRRNAYFNLTKLGAGAVGYLVDFYGPMEDVINKGDESDRLLIRWDLDSERARAAAAGHPIEPKADAGTRLVKVPDDIVAIRRSDPTLAGRWRHEVREALGGAMSNGFRVTGFTSDFEYVLSRG